MGTRLRPLTEELPKALVPILNRPLIAYGIELLAAAGLREIVVVVAGNDNRTGPAALASAPPEVRVTIAVQPEPLGSADAVVCVGEPLTSRHVVVLAVDTLLRGELRPHIDAFLGSDSAGWLVLHTTDRPQQMGIAILEGDEVIDFEEKPEQPRSNLALVGVWMLSPVVIERIRTNPVINQKGEADLSATVALMLGEGHRVGGRIFEGDWLDVGAIESLLATQSTLLSTMRGGAPDGHVAARTVIHHPVLIGAGAMIEDSTIGPNVVIGEGSVLRNVRMTNALVAPGTTLEGFDGDHLVVTSNGEIGRVMTE